MTSFGTALVALAALAVGFTLGWLVREQRLSWRASARQPGRGSDGAATEWAAESEPFLALQAAFVEAASTQTVAGSILTALAQILPAEDIQLCLLDRHRQTLTEFRLDHSHANQALSVGPEMDLPPADGLTGWVLTKREALCLHACQEKGGLPEGVDPEKVSHHSYMAVPLELVDELFGTLEAAHSRSAAFTPTHFSLLKLVGAQASAALHLDTMRRESQAERKRMQALHTAQIEELNRRRSLVDALLEMTSELTSSVDLDRVYARASSLVAEAIQADRGYLLVRESKAGDALRVGAAVARNRSTPEAITIDEIPGAVLDLALDVVRSQEGAWIADIADSALSDWDELDDPARSAIAVPLLMGEDVLGGLVFSSKERSAFSEDHIRLASAAAQQLSGAMYNAELYNLIRDQATNLGSMLREKQIETGTSHAVLESIADGVIATDADDRVVVFNRSAERILGLSTSDIVGRPVFEITSAYGGAAQRLKAAIAKWRDRPSQDENAEDYLEERITLEDKRVVSLQLAPVTIRDEFLGTVSIFRDVTREVEVDRLKSEFVATVSHELRTPMTSIKGYVEMILMGAVGDLNADQRRFLQVIRSNIERLGDLVNDLLDISRIESGRVSLELIHLDLRGLLREVRETFERRTRLEDKPMQIDLDLPEQLPYVRADPARIRQVLTNLIANSFNYTPPGGRITISAWDSDGEVIIRVTDNGMGIPPQEHAKVFERFYRGEGALDLSISGTGLGLPIVKELVEMHQGRIWLESEGVPGEGSQFTFSLPLASRQLEPV